MLDQLAFGDKSVCTRYFSEVFVIPNNNLPHMIWNVPHGLTKKGENERNEEGEISARIVSMTRYGERNFVTEGVGGEQTDGNISLATCPYIGDP